MADKPLPARTIAIDVADVEQLFETYDPSPFHDESLNHVASDYIITHTSNAKRDQPFEIALTVKQLPADAAEARRLEAVLASHYGQLAVREDFELRKTLREGFKSLGIGIIILAVCTTIAQFIDAAPIRDGLREGLRDGLSVFGWVANWRPVEILFYDWWPIKANRDLYRRLAVARVQGEIAAASESP